MTKFDNKFISVQNVPKTETKIVLNDWSQEVKKSNLSVAARNKIINRSGSNYLSKNGGNYGPCRNTLCGCSCSSSTCTCKNASVWVGGTGAGLAASGRAWCEMNNVGAGGQVGAAVFSNRENKGHEVRFLSGSAGGKIGVTPAGINLKGELGANLYDFKKDGIQAKVGANVDTGVSVSDKGVEVKVLGFGFSFGEKMEISTPLASVSRDTGA